MDVAMQARQFLLIANPIAGGGEGRAVAPLLQEELRARGCAAELVFTAARGDARKHAAAVEPGSVDGVVAVGGDGTLNEVLSGLRDPGTPLGAMPVGTGNVMAKALHLPRDPGRFADVLLNGRCRETAIGLVQGRRFLLFASSGIDASIVQRVTETRRGTLGKLRYLPAILQVLLRWPIATLSFTTDGDERHEGYSTVIATRVDSYSSFARFPGSFDLGDRVLHVFAFPQRSRLAYLRVGLRGVFGRLRPGRDVFCTTAETLSIRAHTAKTPWQLDGDLGGTGSIDIRLDPRPARLFAL